MDPKQDRRIIRTCKQLRDAMIELMRERGFDEISVRDITDRADLGRATFYLHYRDKKELLLEILDTIASEYVQKIQEVTPIDWTSPDNSSVKLIFEYSAKNADLYQVIMKGQGRWDISLHLHEIIANHVGQFIQTTIAKTRKVPAVPPDFLANYFAGSLLSLIFWWLEKKMPYSADQMVEYFRKVSPLDILRT